jgi:citrate synthase
MTTYVRAAEAARLLGVRQATLYAYVSRGRIERLRAADGRTSLFALDDIEALRQVSHRSDVAPRPTIDVQIASAITLIGDDGIEIRGLPLVDIAGRHRFEDVAELLWTGRLPARASASPTIWPAAERRDVDAVAATLDAARAAAIHLDPMQRVVVAATLLDALHHDDEPIVAARRLLGVAPSALGRATRSGAFAHRLATVWLRRPRPAVVDAIDLALSLLADHELATSTLAVRVAASVRVSAYAALVAGLATVGGSLHGSAAMHVHHFLEECRRDGTADVLDAARVGGRRIPGFGHKIYRRTDPRFLPLLDAVRAIDPTDERLAIADDVLNRVVLALPTQPNVDFALGALTWIANIPADAPIFAVARIAGWTAHYVEELGEAPVRFRGLARTPT